MLHFSIYGHEHGTVFISKDNPVDPALYTWIEITDEEFLQIYNWMKKTDHMQSRKWKKRIDLRYWITRDNMRYLFYMMGVDMITMTIITILWGKTLGIYVTFMLSFVLGTVILFLLAERYDNEDCGCPDCHPFTFAAMINIFLCIGIGLICIYVNITQGSL